ncbi:MAG: helix-hairpin-helix domain-containing protein [Dictyoglomaceae bacterium]
MDPKYKRYVIIGSIILLLIFANFVANFNDKKEEKENVESYIIVHIAGAVKEPGVYKLLEGSRVIDGIQAAGGALPSADLDKLNLADYLEDGCKIFVPEKILPSNPSFKSEKEVVQKNNISSNSNKVNINYASEKELENLPGIGPSLARRIIEYREQNGPFKSLEDLEKVKGIGPRKIEQIKDLIEW